MKPYSISSLFSRCLINYKCAIHYSLFLNWNWFDSKWNQACSYIYFIVCVYVLVNIIGFSFHGESMISQKTMELPSKIGVSYKRAIQLNSPESSWTHLNSPESTWIQLNSPESTWTHLYPAGFFFFIYFFLRHGLLIIEYFSRVNFKGGAKVKSKRSVQKKKKFKLILQNNKVNC